MVKIMFLIYHIHFHIAASADHSSADCFTCVISTHGDQDVRPNGSNMECNDIVYGVDGILYLKTLLRLFKPDVSPSLRGKPKLFFIQV